MPFSFLAVMWSVREELSTIVVGTIVEMDVEVTDGTSKTLSPLVSDIMPLSTCQNFFSSDTMKDNERKRDNEGHYYEE